MFSLMDEHFCYEKCQTMSFSCFFYFIGSKQEVVNDFGHKCVGDDVRMSTTTKNLSFADAGEIEIICAKTSAN